jgi:hypothetical protein
MSKQKLPRTTQVPVRQILGRPLLSAAATGAQLGQAFQWDGTLVSRNTKAPNIYSGNVVPSATVVPQPRTGDEYKRVDQPSIYLYGTAWMLVPLAAGQVASTGLTTAQAAATILTPAVDWMYMVSGYIVVTTAATSGTISLNAIWTDPVGVRTQDILTTVGLGDVNVAATNWSEGDVYVRARSTGPIQWSTTFNAVVGVPTYSVYMTVTQLSG